MNDYKAISTNESEIVPLDLHTTKIYKIFVGEKLRMLYIDVGVFTNKQEADKIYLDTIRNITAFCKENSDRTETSCKLHEREYRNDKYASIRPVIISENYYQITETNILAYNKGIFYGENIVLEYYIYNTEISIPIGQFTTEFYPAQMPVKD